MIRSTISPYSITEEVGQSSVGDVLQLNRSASTTTDITSNRVIHISSILVNNKNLIYIIQSVLDLMSVFYPHFSYNINLVRTTTINNRSQRSSRQPSSTVVLIFMTLV